MKHTIRARLAQIEAEHNVRILYACESGSRAWGFASSDSDYDVRFIYARRLDAYLALHPVRDTIEVMDGDLDLAGWDVKKALTLAGKSNAGLLEWLHSPIIYVEDEAFTPELRRILRDFSPQALAHHYLNMAQRTHRTYWCDWKPVPYKKYLYALRPLLCILWMQAHGYRSPPVDFVKTLSGVVLEPGIRDGIADLLALKRAGDESAGGRFPVLDEFIDDWIAYGREVCRQAPTGDIASADLDALFRDTVLRGALKPIQICDGAAARGVANRIWRIN